MPRRRSTAPGWVPAGIETVAVHHDVKVAGRSARFAARLTAARDAECHPLLDSGGDFDGKCFLASDLALAVAFGTELVDDRAATIARGASGDLLK